MANDCACRAVASLATSPPRQAPTWRHLCLLGLLALPVPAFAELALVASAGVEYQYDSNVFDLPKPLLPPPLFVFPPGLGAFHYSDSYVAYNGKLDASYLWSQQQFYATIAGDEYRYDRFSFLNHSEYNFDAGWDWKLGRLLDGVLDVNRIRSMVFFFDTNNTIPSLTLQTEQRETGKAGLQFTPDWRGEVLGMTRKVDQPQVGAPDLSLDESMGQGAVKYTGTAGVTAGLTGSYLHGEFKNAVANAGVPGATLIFLAPATYHQVSGALTATDVVTGISTFRGQVGYTRRSSDSDINSTSGVTGELDYQRALTGKTTAELDLTRQINVYMANTGSEIDTIAALNLNWQATFKIGVALGYAYTYRQLPDQGDNGGERKDRLNQATLAITYEPVRWATLKPYFKYVQRSSRDFLGGDFNSTVVGIDLTFQLQKGTIPPRTSLLQ